ncbi:hypothetical protein ACVIGB_008711 [Bradyrhizobium sp. USDA 4341]
MGRAFLVHRSEDEAEIPDVEGDRPAKKRFKSYPIGFFHIDIAEVRTEQGELHMFVAIDPTSKFAYVELHERATPAVSREFLLRLIAVASLDNIRRVMVLRRLHY